MKPTIKALLRKAVNTSAFVPVLCGSAFKNKGVQPLLDAVVDYLPAPIDVPPIKGIDLKTEKRSSAADRRRAVVAAGVQDHERPLRRHPDLRPHLFGQAAPRHQVINSVKDKKEQVGRMLLMHANDREDIDEAYAGDIVALAGLKDTTPATRCAIRRADHPRADGIPRAGHRGRGRAEDQGRPGEDGHCAQPPGAEDPSFRVSTDHETGQTIIKGMGELHLDIIVDRMRREFKVEANVGAPQVAYRETLAKQVNVDYTHKKQTGGTGQYARVKITLDEPPEQAEASSSRTRSSAVPCPRNTCRASKRA